MLTEMDVELPDGRILHAYDTGTADDGRLPVLWHHGTPNLGRPPEPLFPAAGRLGLRWMSYDRPGYGGSTPNPGRNIVSAASDVARLADALGIDRFAVMGHSGGGPHALACGALLPDRVACVVSGSAPAPYDAPGLDWFAGMAPDPAASLRAAVAGREEKERYESSDEERDPGFIAADQAALAGKWSWLLDVVRPALAAGPAALIDDDLATVAPWGFDPTLMDVPVLILHGGRDRMIPVAHGEWLANRCRTAELWLFPEDGHVSVLNSAEPALDWLRSHAG